ncbi:hypothetical protein AB7M74_011242 [Bradyrhizobium japonicum]
MPRAKTHAAVILREYHKAESELIGKAVVLTDGKAGTVDLRLPTIFETRPNRKLESPESLMIL